MFYVSPYHVELLIRSTCNQKNWSFLHTSGSYTAISFADKIKNKSIVLILIMQNLTLIHDVKAA